MARTLAEIKIHLKILSGGSTLKAGAREKERISADSFHRAHEFQRRPDPNERGGGILMLRVTLGHTPRGEKKG